MTPYEKQIFASGFMLAFALAARVQTDAFGRIGDCLGALEQTVEQCTRRHVAFGSCVAWCRRGAGTVSCYFVSRRIGERMLPFPGVMAWLSGDKPRGAPLWA